MSPLFLISIGKYGCWPSLEDPSIYFPEIVLKPEFLICIVLASTLVHEADLTAALAELWFALCLEGFPKGTELQTTHCCSLLTLLSNSHFLLECRCWGADEWLDFAFSLSRCGVLWHSLRCTTFKRNWKFPSALYKFPLPPFNLFFGNIPLILSWWGVCWKSSHWGVEDPLLGDGFFT